MFNFFSNNLIYVDSEQLEITKSLENQRPNLQKIFYVPQHTVGTDNLLIFLNGELKIKNKDYEDYNSNSIQFKNYIDTKSNFVSILIKGNSILEWGYF